MNEITRTTINLRNNLRYTDLRLLYINNLIGIKHYVRFINKMFASSEAINHLYDAIKYIGITNYISYPYNYNTSEYMIKAIQLLNKNIAFINDNFEICLKHNKSNINTYHYDFYTNKKCVIDESTYAKLKDIVLVYKNGLPSKEYLNVLADEIDNISLVISDEYDKLSVFKEQIIRKTLNYKPIKFGLLCLIKIDNDIVFPSNRKLDSKLYINNESYSKEKFMIDMIKLCEGGNFKGNEIGKKLQRDYDKFSKNNNDNDFVIYDDVECWGC